MKQAILNVKKKLLLVELPEGEQKNISTLVLDDYAIKTKVLIGKLTDITEEQFAELVDKLMADQHFQNYNWQGTIVDRWIKTAKESFFSYLEGQGILFEKNEKPMRTDSYERDGGSEQYEMEIEEWQEAESKVWKKDNCYLFLIL